jgi:hypothetical protein
VKPASISTNFFNILQFSLLLTPFSLPLEIAPITNRASLSVISLKLMTFPTNFPPSSSEN